VAIRLRNYFKLSLMTLNAALHADIRHQFIELIFVEICANYGHCLPLPLPDHQSPFEFAGSGIGLSSQIRITHQIAEITTGIHVQLVVFLSLAKEIPLKL
jgi:hypothetical protein